MYFCTQDIFWSVFLKNGKYSLLRVEFKLHNFYFWIESLK